MLLKRKWTFVFLAFVLIMDCQLSWGQVQDFNAVPRELNSNELVTFDRSIPIQTALKILSQYSLKYENRVIIDTANKSGPINVMVDNMYWRRALEYILRSNLMRFEIRENYYEVIPLIEPAETGEDIIHTSTHEVEIDAIFFEADYEALTEAGVDWSVIFDGKVRVSNTFASQVNEFNNLSVTYGNSWENIAVTAVLRAFESMDKGEVIANPQIKVMDGEEGKIQVGDNFFLTTQDFAGNTRFQEYESGIILTVTPTVVKEADTTFIHLDIQAERSTVLPAAEQVVKRITDSNTQVLLLDGEETAIAGLFSNEVTTKRNGIPILKDLPPWFFGLRYLFGYESKNVKKKELIIILKAKVVPTIKERVRFKLAQKQILLQKRREFLRKLQEIKRQDANKSSPATNPATSRRQ
jgi:type IV pilus assembly protein PilQ